jgi:lipopolysaccharide export system protein LptA
MNHKFIMDIKEMKNNIRSCATGFLFIMLISGAAMQAAHAEKADLNKPTNVEADQMFYDESKSVNTFIGNVVLTRGTLIMHAEKMVVKQDKAGYQYTTLYASNGGTTRFRQKRDGGADLWIEGYAADRIEYDNKTEIAKLYKQAKVKMLDGGRPTDEVEGEFISYDSKAEFYTVNNSVTGETKPGGGRVRAIIQPRSEEKSKDGK